jgi:hypothetical protein
MCQTIFENVQIENNQIAKINGIKNMSAIQCIRIRKFVKMCEFQKLGDLVPDSF